MLVVLNLGKGYSTKNRKSDGKEENEKARRSSLFSLIQIKIQNSSKTCGSAIWDSSIFAHR